MRLMFPDVVVGLPFGSAVLLACIGSWRAGVWINAAATTLAFILTCLLPWQFRTVLPAHLALLSAFVAMTTSWFGWRDVRAALAARRLDRRGTRHHHVAFQALLGGVLLAVLSDSPAMTWLGTTIAIAAAAGLTGVVHSPEARDAAGQLLLLCGVGLMLALFGTLLLEMAARPDAALPRWGGSRLALICLVLGYGGIAGLVPLHAWLADAVDAVTPQAATLIGALLANLPLLVILRLRSAMTDGQDSPIVLLVVVGLATLLLAAFCLAARPALRRGLTFAGTALVGVIVFAFGLGGTAATMGGLLLMTMLTFARASALQCHEGPANGVAAWTRTASVLCLAGLLIFGLFLVAGTTATTAPWLLLPLGVGMLLATGSLLVALPARGVARRDGSPDGLLGLAPIWLQLALVVFLAVAMPGPVVGWFRTMAEFR
jgi:hydrogenase-4 component F